MHHELLKPGRKNSYTWSHGQLSSRSAIFQVTTENHVFQAVSNYLSFVAFTVEAPRTDVHSLADQLEI
jgi:hypothetical protein